MSGQSFRLLVLHLTENIILFSSITVGRFSQLYVLIRKRRKYVYAQSYYPEEKLKSKSTIFLDQLEHVLKHGEINEFYFVYGLDRLSKTDTRAYVPLKKFTHLRDKKNAILKTPNYNYLCLLRDKLSFGAYCRGLGINVPVDLGVISKQRVQLLHDRKIVSVDELFNYNIDAFCKPETGLQGKGAFHLRIKNGAAFKDNENISISQLTAMFGNEEWIIQKRINNQHSRLNALYPGAINTIRLTTVYTGSEVESLGAALRMGAFGSKVDNWSAGGIIVPVNDKTGTLTTWGYFKPRAGSKVTHHPDTNTAFEGYQIPFYNEAVKQAKYLHFSMKGIHSIGWDIAITETGPLFVEGNDRWHAFVYQLINGGMKRSYERLFKGKQAVSAVSQFINEAAAVNGANS